MSSEGNDIQITMDYSFSNNDNTLTLTEINSGATTVYNKQ
jgi:hypothetical protein